jgi:2-polyprenyl-3-methyl-5-hydroxy-6-metoxy-1,4-benzoquinol methylase
MGKLEYLQRSVARQFVPKYFHCPNCGGSRSHLETRKYLVTQLRRCGDCQLLFRTPTDDPANNADFYEHDYAQGFTTDMPSDAALAELIRTSFVGTEKDYTYYIGVLAQLGLKAGDRIFDLGCSWGYGSYQLGKAGFSVTAFEVARSRKRYAVEKLRVDVVDDVRQASINLAGTFDCFFSSHVLEHVPSPGEAIEHAMRLLKLGGLFVSFTPNGSDAFRNAVPEHWNKLWGEVHPNFLDDRFLDWSFRQSPRAVGSSPVSRATLSTGAELTRLDDLGQDELFFVARKVSDHW